MHLVHFFYKPAHQRSVKKGYLKVCPRKMLGRYEIRF